MNLRRRSGMPRGSTRAFCPPPIQIQARREARALPPLPPQAARRGELLGRQSWRRWRAAAQRREPRQLADAERTDSKACAALRAIPARYASARASAASSSALLNSAPSSAPLPAVPSTRPTPSTAASPAIAALEACLSPLAALEAKSAATLVASGSRKPASRAPARRRGRIRAAPL